MTISIQHWTSNSLKEFAFWIASDFTAQIESAMETNSIDNRELANTLELSTSRVSQVLNNPGNLTLGNAVKFARGTGHKVALVLYNDGDPGNERGPISAAIFEECWRRLGRPTEMQPEIPTETGILVPKKSPANAALTTFPQAASGGNIGRAEANLSSQMEA